MKGKTNAIESADKNPQFFVRKTPDEGCGLMVRHLIPPQVLHFRIIMTHLCFPLFLVFLSCKGMTVGRRILERARCCSHRGKRFLFSDVVSKRSLVVSRLLHQIFPLSLLFWGSGRLHWRWVTRGLFGQGDDLWPRTDDAVACQLPSDFGVNLLRPLPL